MSDAHLDFFGVEITVDTKVVIPRGNTLKLCNVEKLTPKMALVAPVSSKGYRKSHYVYCNQTVVVNSDDVLAYILKNGG